MAKIDKSESNIYDIPKGANVVKGGAVYINASNYRVVPTDGRKPFVSHTKLCIGKVVEGKKGKFYANDNYKRKFLKEELPLPPEKNDSLSVGSYAIATTVDEKFEVRKILKEAGFTVDQINMIMDLVLYMLDKESAVFQHFPSWARDNATFSDSISSDSTISKFVNGISYSEIQLFKDKWLEAILKKNDKVFLCYDSTNVNSQAEGVSLVEKGHAKDDKTLNQVNTEYVVRQEDGIPVTYMQYPGSICDIAEAEEMIKYLGKFNKDTKMTAVCDRGYISEDNVTYFNEHELGFLLLLKSNTNASKKLITDHAKEVKDRYGCYIPEYGIYGKTFRIKLFKNSNIECYAHLIYDVDLERDHREALHNTINAQRLEIQRHIDRKDKLTEDNLKKYFMFDLELEPSETIIAPAKGRGVKKTEQPSFVIKSFKENEDVIAEEFSYCGFFILVTSDEMTVKEAVCGYSKRDSVEKVFESLKSHLGMDKIGVHTEESMQGKTFLWFIASIFRSSISYSLSSLRESSNNKKDYTTPAAIDRLDAIKADKNLSSGKYERRYKLTKAQKEICKCLDIKESLIDEIIGEIC